MVAISGVVGTHERASTTSAQARVSVEPIIRMMPSPRRGTPAPSNQSASQSSSIAIPSPADVVLIVTGSTIAAETRDRPLAYRLREHMPARMDQREAEPSIATESTAAAGLPNPTSTTRLHPTVCSDLWYLNDRELAQRPAIAIGEPNANAATSLISSRLPTVFVIEGSLRVHMDPEFIDLRAALWGVNAAATAAAIDLFAERYLNEFLCAASD
jgi:hypothetical protein